MVGSAEKVQALKFVRQYAVENQFFTGGDVLAAYRAAGHNDPEGGWRNTWPTLIVRGAKSGWYVKAGRAAPTTAQSHTATLVQWQSRLFNGTQSLVGKTIRDHVIALRKSVVLRELTIEQALWKAYGLGVENCE